MGKDKVIQAKQELLNWAESLKDVPDDIWFKSFNEGSWGTADVISHFISWDRFVLENRLYPLLKRESFPEVQVDIEEINQKASKYARSGITKEDLLDELISIRQEVIAAISELPETEFHQLLPGKSITLLDYFFGLIKHDEHHIQQINTFIQKY
ncbi:DinB family protein [Fredinandcohnia sp. 179-A 10B2 NHS]|uniref:DinB family protein n=1 Tax=Fredinandcohnia sp. 179-A 10B2 NHS TaxID=3235176 RepID=UPI0039A2A425